MFKSQKIIKEIVAKVQAAGVQVESTSFDGTTISINTECDWMARDVLNWERFTNYVDDIEVILF